MIRDDLSGSGRQDAQQSGRYAHAENYADPKDFDEHRSCRYHSQNQERKQGKALTTLGLMWYKDCLVGSRIGLGIPA